jgi:predicted nucleic acid-binding protein
MMKYNVTESDIEGLLDRLATTAKVIVPESRPPVSVRDPRDEHILALALAGNADFLVTGDNDLLVLAADPRLGKLRIVTVAAFLALLAGSPNEENPAR